MTALEFVFVVGAALSLFMSVVAVAVAFNHTQSLRHTKHHHHHLHHHVASVALWVVIKSDDDIFHCDLAILHPGKEKYMSVTVTVGHTVSFSLVYLDQNGNPMLTAPVPDAAPVWTDTTPATGTLTPAASGLTASELAIAAGTDTVNVAVAVGGKAFAASVDLAVHAAPQVLTTVGISSTVN